MPHSKSQLTKVIGILPSRESFRSRRLSSFTAELKTRMRSRKFTLSKTPNQPPEKFRPSSAETFVMERPVTPCQSPSEEEKRTHSKRMACLGLLYGLISGLFFSLCAASVKYLTEVDPGQVAFYQYIAIAAFSFPMLVLANENVLGPHKSCRYWMLLCGTFDAVTVYLSFISFRYIPLSDATVLTSSVPVFVTITARIFLKEKCGSAQILAIVVSSIGVALVTKLPLLMASRTNIYTRESVIGLLASLGSIATESGVYIILRKLHDVNVFVILFNFGCVATFVNAALTAAFGEFTLAGCGLQQWLVIAVGVFSFLSQMALTKALELEEAGPVSVLMAAGDILLAFILDMTLFSDSPDEYTYSGTVLVILSVIAVGFKKSIDKMTQRICLKRKVVQMEIPTRRIEIE